MQYLSVKVIASAHCDAIRGVMADGTMKVAVKAPRDGGKANVALCRLLAAHFHIPIDCVTIIRGQQSTKKVVCLPTLKIPSS